jgi:hypothetical protein
MGIRDGCEPWICIATFLRDDWDGPVVRGGPGCDVNFLAHCCDSLVRFGWSQRDS